MSSKKSAQSPDAPVKPVEDRIIDPRALGVGVALSAILGAGMVFWKVASAIHSNEHIAPKAFEFSIAPPQQQTFQIREPVRDIARETKPELAPEPQAIEERPDIHITTSLNPAPSDSEVIQSPNTAQDVSTELKIDPKSIDVAMKPEVSIADAPQEISAVTETVQYAIQPIAVSVPTDSELFKYDQPAPADHPAVYSINAAPRPGRSIKGVLQAFGEQDAPSMGRLGPANINLFGTGDLFRSVTRSGGVKARGAVDSALGWLAANQSADGMWDAKNLDGQPTASLADTALATLAFMGGGNTSRKGEYSRNVMRGIEAILRHQKEDGQLTQDGANLYTHAICTIALCEAYGRARDERIGAAAQKAINYCERAVDADGGWRYVPKAESSDLSVTAWFVQALKTARLAQLKTDHTLFSQAQSYLDSVTDQGASRESSGAVGYQFQADQNLSGNGHPALTCAGMVIRQFSGTGVKNHLLVKGAELTRQAPPTWQNKNFYYWYYATYAMHNMGGEYRVWWNQRIRDTLLENQSHEGVNSGSWDPKGDQWGNAGGRVYTTALGALCLEVYYRYSEALNSFGTAPDLDELIANE